MSRIVQIHPEEVTGKPHINLVVGTVPPKNEWALRIVYPVILPGLEEMHKYSNDWWSPFGIRQAVFDGALELTVGYSERSETKIDESKFQEYFAQKLQNPTVDYVGFYLLQYMPHCMNVFLTYIVPRYRSTNVSSLAFETMEKHARALKLPRIQTTTLLWEDGTECTPDSWMERQGFKVSHKSWVKKLEVEK